MTSPMEQRKASIGLQLVWHAAFLVMLLWLLPAAVLGAPLSGTSGVNKQSLEAFALTYTIAVVIYLTLTKRFWVQPLLVALLLSAGTLAIVYLWVLLHSESTYSRALILMASTLVIVGLIAPAVPAPERSRRPLGWLLVAGILGVLLAITVRRGGGFSSVRERLAGRKVQETKSKRDELVAASGYMLSVSHYTQRFPAYGKPALGGAITRDPRGSGYLLVRSRGELYRFNWDSAGEPKIEPIGLRVPINNADFEADVPKSGIETEGFRVAGLLAQAEGQATRIFVTHHFWKRPEKCFVVRLETALIPAAGRVTDSSSQQWRTIYETSPCLQLKHARGTPFAGVQMGGRLASLGQNRLLMTVGDHQFDGWYGSPDYVEDLKTPYGKVMLIDVATGSASIFTSGNRNEQGLTIDAAGRIWETEHGPQGGDELNLLKQGQNYGWPHHTYGTEYGSVIWPPAADSTAAPYVRPVYAWVPSIGISDLVSVQDSAFERWRNDLLIASLRAQQLWRVRIEEGRVVYAEPIQIGERIRDITSGKGEFVLWTDKETIIRIRPASAVDKGAEAYSLNCGSCHHLQENRTGPRLAGVVGREVASSPGYDYSAAMKSFGGKWTEGRLDGFLARPDSAVPGTAMRYGGISDSTTRRAIIAFLKSTHP